MIPIRVLHVVGNMDAGGMETLVMNWYRKIDKSVVQFDFLVHTKKKAFYEDEINSLGGRVYHFSILDDKNIFKYIRQLYVFFRIHKEFEIIHGHHSALGPIYLFLAKISGVKTRISHSHIASYSKSFRGRTKYLITRFFGTFANYHFACSVAAGRYMYGNVEFEVINNGIDVERFKFRLENRREIRSDFNINESQLLIAHVGRFHDQKNHSFIIDVFYEIKKMFDSSKLLLVGQGPLKDKTEEKVRKLDLMDDVIFAGSRSDVEKILSASDVFIFPSLYEGLPLTVVEAQCSGLPVICSDNVTTETKLTDLYNTMSLNESPQKWARKIHDLINAPINRSSSFNLIRQAGYDSVDVVNKIQNFYLNNI